MPPPLNAQREIDRAAGLAARELKKSLVCLGMLARGQKPPGFKRDPTPRDAISAAALLVKLLDKFAPTLTAEIPRKATSSFRSELDRLTALGAFDGLDDVASG